MPGKILFYKLIMLTQEHSMGSKKQKQKKTPSLKGWVAYERFYYSFFS